ncbi:hypothetical protein Ocin01_07110 [Orchesella cincta]|uniref:Uncharacterized protein n=1 Tax=Orchesella cincta TaxID=48709 RepID=A0A1D2N2W2_ORCCI|nr:hypothetical protein Ocin01_07110 [Orchesella cincta]
MASASPLMSVLWLLILIFIGFWVAGVCAGFYIILYCIEACIPDLKSVNDILLKGVQFPYTCAKNMLSGEKVF